MSFVRASRTLNKRPHSLNIQEYRPVGPHRIPRRAFHLPTTTELANECLIQSHALFETIHTTTSLPWHFAIPIAALAVRTSLLPFMIYSHLLDKRRQNAIPLEAAWRHAWRRRATRENPDVDVAHIEGIIDVQSKEAFPGIRRSLFAQPWKGLVNWMHIPVWLAMTDTLRRMCGVNDSPFKLLFAFLASGGEYANVNTPVDATALVPFEPSLASEGALWFHDLLQPDVYPVLPCIYSISLFMNLHYNIKRDRKGMASSDGWQLLRLASLFSGCFVWAIPNGILLYWISSSTCALGYNILLQQLIPTKGHVGSCNLRKMHEAQREKEMSRSPRRPEPQSSRSYV